MSDDVDVNITDVIPQIREDDGEDPTGEIAPIVSSPNRSLDSADIGDRGKKPLLADTSQRLTHKVHRKGIHLPYKDTRMNRFLHSLAHKLSAVHHATRDVMHTVHYHRERLTVSLCILAIFAYGLGIYVGRASVLFVGTMLAVSAAATWLIPIYAHMFVWLDYGSARIRHIFSAQRKKS